MPVSECWYNRVNVPFVIVAEFTMWEHYVETKMYIEIGWNRFNPYTRHIGILAEWMFNSTHS